MSVTKENNPHKKFRKRFKSIYRDQGLDRFEQHKILELMLFYSIPLKETNSTAHSLMDAFGSFHKVLEADYEELIKVKGIGEHSATMIKLFHDVSRVYAIDKARKTITVLQSTEKIIEFITPLFKNLTKEVCYVIYLNNRLEVLNPYPSPLKYTQGGIDFVHVDIRDIVQGIIKYKATNIIVTHNHPAGFALASYGDIETTENIRKAVSVYSVNLLDHIIVDGHEDSISFAESNLLK